MIKEIPTNSFSVILVEAMRAKGLNTSKLARETGISERFIRLMLEEKTDRLPAAPYLHGYIMKIAEKLELNGEEIWNTYFKDDGNLKSSGISDRLPKNRFAVSRINKKILIFAILVIAVIAYFVVQTILGFDISRKLSLENFDEGIVVSEESTYKIKGNIAPGFQLTINDVSIQPEEDGEFEKTIELEPNFNNVIFKVEGPFNKKERLVKQIYFQTEPVENEATSTPANIVPENTSELEDMPTF